MSPVVVTDMPGRRVNLHRHLTADTLRDLRARSTWRGVGMIVHCWSVIAAAMALVAWLPNPVTILFAIAVIGSRQLGLAILMHEGAHGGLAVSPRVNMWLSQWLCGYPVAADTLAYRAYHLEHHKYAQEENDPDLHLSAKFPTTRASMRRKLIRDLTGQTGFKQRRSQLRAALGKAGQPAQARLRHFRRALGGPLIVNAVLFGILAFAGYWWLYPLLWVMPLLTWQQAVTRIRNIAEHAVLPPSDPWRVARTTRVDSFTRAFLAPYWVNYHAEHHLLLYVPCYRLKRFHDVLAQAELVERLEVRGGYGETLRMATALG